MIARTGSARTAVLNPSAAEPGAPCGLSAAECRTCAALPEHRRADWRASRMAAKSAAAAALGMPEDALEATPPAPGERPRLALVSATGPVPAPLSLSVSHRDGRGAAVADLPGRKVGIDLERADAAADGTERYFLSPAERRDAGSLGPAALWSLKEAAWKALGCGPSTPFTALRLHFDGDSTLEAVELSGRRMPARAEVSTPWPGYVLSVVWVEEEAP